MKAYIRGEAIGDDAIQLSRFYEGMLNMILPNLGTAICHMPSNIWAAEITGFDPKYKYKRKFLRGKKDYSHANSKGSRGVYVEWVLESGRIYQIKRPVSWNNVECFFCTVNENGDIISLSEQEVIECLKRRSALMCLPQQNNVSLMCLTTFPAFTYHSAEEKTAR